MIGPMRRVLVRPALLFIGCGDDTTAPMTPKDLSVPHSDCGLVSPCARGTAASDTIDRRARRPLR